MKRIYAILLGLLIIALSVWSVATPNKFVRRMVTELDNFMYDSSLINLMATTANKKNKNVSPIVIVDVDEKSLAEQGTWPWPKARFAELLNELNKQHVAVAVFTIVFFESADTTATDYLKKLQAKNSNNAELIQLLNKLIYLHEGDQILANAIEQNPVILGILFNQSNYSKGFLPAPEIEISNANLKHFLIPTFTGYSANLEILQKNAKQAGFVTGIVDNDGIVRHAPLVGIYKNGIYLSLALEAVKYYLNNPKIQIQFNTIGDKQAVSKIILGDKIIDTDEIGSIVIPYQGSSHHFPYYSATDLLEHRIPPETLAGKIVFIGTDVPGLGDLRPTPLQSLFPGVEIQSNIAAAILGNFIPYKPNWSRGAEIGLIIIIGAILAAILPFLSAIWLAIALIVLVAVLIYLYIWLWTVKGLIFSFSVPILTVIVLIIANLIYGFLFEARKRQKLFKTFTQYVPPEYAKKITEQAALEEEIRTVTILFTDIRHFTDIAENLSAHEVKEFLNRFVTPMTEIIFKHQGTIDKYFGDMIMAFWGAPNEDLLQTQHALDAALEMQKKARKLRSEFIKLDLPLIKIGIGINTGEVSLGEVGSDIRRSYTILGDAVNLASRIESLTKFYNARIIVGENTYAETRDNYIFRHLDRIAVKGKHKPVEIYELICKKEDATEALLTELEEHEYALNLYYERQWVDAYEQFSNLAKSYPTVKVYAIFRRRIKEFLKSSPDASWDGTFIKMEK